jgi:sulfur dioxygenase
MNPITATELKAALDAGTSLRLLDVREPAEFVSDLGHIDGAELIPLGTLTAARLAGEQRDIICICRSGMRAGKAAQLLAAAGLKTRVLTGGMLAWNEARLPIKR